MRLGPFFLFSSANRPAIASRLLLLFKLVTNFNAHFKLSQSPLSRAEAGKAKCQLIHSHTCRTTPMCACSAHPTAHEIPGVVVFFFPRLLEIPLRKSPFGNNLQCSHKEVSLRVLLFILCLITRQKTSVFASHDFSQDSVTFIVIRRHALPDPG